MRGIVGSEVARGLLKGLAHRGCIEEEAKHPRPFAWFRQDSFAPAE